jgi:lipopolysaccharide transport system permease protein
MQLDPTRTDSHRGHGEEGWDVVIAPAQPWWRLDLGELWRYRDLLKELVVRDLTAMYKQTVLGPIWVVVQPMITSITFAVVFGLIARMSTPGIPGLLFYMSGVVPWSFFAGVITKTSATLMANAPLMTKVYFPRLIPPLSTMLSAGFTFLVQLAFFFLFALFYRLSGLYAWAPGKAMLLLPALLLVQMMLAFGTGLIVAALTTRWKDLNFLITFAVQMLMYASPVIFPLSRLVPGSKTYTLIAANPMTPIIEGFRAALLGTPAQLGSLWYSFLVASLMLLLGLALFQRAQRSYADVI